MATGKRARGAPARRGTKRAKTRGVFVARAVSHGIAPELKFYDTNLADNALTAPTDSTAGEKNPSATITLNTVTQGDGESQRDGRQISMTNIGIRGHIRVPAIANATAADEAFNCFVALVLDTQSNGALLASENVFINPGGDAQMAAQPWRNLQFTKRFKVLASTNVTFERSPELTYDGTNMEQGGMIKIFSMFADLKGMKVTYSGTSESIANTVDNSLNVIAWTSDVASAPVLSYSARLRFMG